MSRPVALAIAWGLATWNGVALLGFATNTAVATIAAPAGIAVAILVGLLAARPRLGAPARSRLDLDTERA